MKTVAFRFALLVVLCCVSGCQPGSDEGTIVGSTQDVQIHGLSFIVDTTYIDHTGELMMVAKGRVTNNASAGVSSPWYVEGQFFTDATYKTKLAGNYAQVGVPLSTGQSTFWTLKYTSQNNDLTAYPAFKVSELRGIYKN